MLLLLSFQVVPHVVVTFGINQKCSLGWADWTGSAERKEWTSLMWRQNKLEGKEGTLNLGWFLCEDAFYLFFINLFTTLTQISLNELASPPPLTSPSWMSHFHPILLVHDSSCAIISLVASPPVAGMHRLPPRVLMMATLA